jgi:hypothetical protein
MTTSVLPVGVSEMNMVMLSMRLNAKKKIRPIGNTRVVAIQVPGLRYVRVNSICCSVFDVTR